MQSIQTNLIEAYVQILSSLSPQIRGEIIKRVTESKPEKQPEEAKLARFRALYGSFQSESTAEEIIAEIREARTFTTEIESL